MWSWGNNKHGQLCHGDTKVRSKPQKTPFSNISKISAGKNQLVLSFIILKTTMEKYFHGNNQRGACGLGHFNDPQITPSLILNLPENIVHFVCGGDQNLFLDSEGNVFYNTDQNVLSKIPNTHQNNFMCGFKLLFIDFEENLWTFRFNNNGQLGHR